MNFWKWAVALALIGFAGWTLVQDMREQVRSAEAAAWYRNTQAERPERGNREWKSFKECLQIGERMQDCVDQLD